MKFLLPHRILILLCGALCILEGCDVPAPATRSTTEQAGHEETDHAHGQHSDEVKLTAEAVKQSGIRTERAAMRTLSPMLVAPGLVGFNAESVAHVNSAVRGRVVELNARVGDSVKKGDALLTIESSELGEAQSEYLQHRAAAAVTGATLRALQQAYERSKSLFDENGGIALGEVQKREAEFLSAQGASTTQNTAATAARGKLLLLGMPEGQIAGLEASVSLSPRLVIRAPLDARVIEREVTLGELVSPEKEKLLVLADTSILWVVAQIPETRLDEIAIGAPAQVQVGASKERRVGKVAHIAAELNAGTRTGSVRIELANPKGDVRPGMFARVELQLGGQEEGATPVLVVPEEAVQSFEGGTAVFVPVDGEENTFAARLVTIGESVGGRVRVLTGLKEGEAVVVAGAFLLKAELGNSGAAHEH